jgi:uncharacterized membrane protein required for colicin V production
MSVFVEIVLWAILVVGVALGVRAGFIRMAAKPIKLILSLVLAFTLCTSVAEGIVVPIIEQPITNYIYEFLAENCPELNIGNVVEELPTVLKMAAGMYGINVEEIVAQNAGRDIIAEITAVLSEPVISIFAIIISFVLLFLAFKLVVTLALSLVDLLFSNGVFGALNKVLGGISGAIISVAVAWAVAVIVEFLYHINGTGIENAGILYEFFNTYSPIELLLSF